MIITAQQYMNTVSADIDLPPAIVEIFNAYRTAGKDLFLVGGAVRDYIMGIEPTDWDLVTNVLPDESKLILSDYNVSDEQGKCFGVIRAIVDDCVYEIASYRKDISCDNNDQKVTMGSSITIYDDCLRRDLTINALFYDICNKQIIDMVGGIDDIKNAIVRAVGNPLERIKEDRLRICRIFRFAARYNATIDDDTSSAIKQDNILIGLSRGRIWSEFKKAYKQSPDFNVYLALLTEYNMWGQIFCNCIINTLFKRVSQTGAMNTLFKRVSQTGAMNTEVVVSTNFVIILANLFRFEQINHIFESKLVQQCGMESKLSRNIAFLLEFRDLTTDNVYDIYKKRQRCSIDDGTINEWMEICQLSNIQHVVFLLYKPTVSTQDLIKTGLAGKAIGLEIARLESVNFQRLISNYSCD